MADRYIIIPRLWYKMPPFHLLNETASLFLVHDGMQMLVDTSNDPKFSGFLRVERLKVRPIERNLEQSVFHPSLVTTGWNLISGKRKTCERRDYSRVGLFSRRFN